MTATFTATKTFTITHARYVTSKVAADLRQLQMFYRQPTDQAIAAYAEEAALLLRDGYLERVDYGFQQHSYFGDEWVLLLRYTARNGVLADDHAGRVPSRVDVSGTRFASFLAYSSKFFALTPAERARVEADLPISRSRGRRGRFRRRILGWRPHVLEQQQWSRQISLPAPMTASTELFEAVVELPDRSARRRYGELVGLDNTKERLAKEAQLLLSPDSLARWSKRVHGAPIAACDAFADRPPLFLFAGDVGTGKTALAETFGDQVARTLDISVMLYRLSLASRGSGAVGEMTQLLAGAFNEVRRAAAIPVTTSSTLKAAVILLVDEADALAQSRDTAQMHHEDRAGVNALIRGLNSLTEQRLPVLVVLATNRLSAIDPAVRRRAAATFEFGRPNDAQRRTALGHLLAGITLGPGELDTLVHSTGPTRTRKYGYTYSDLYQRLVPAAVLAAYPDKPLTGDILLATVDAVGPTPPFASETS